MAIEIATATATSRGVVRGSAMAVTTARAMVTAGTPAGAMAARARITAEGSKAPEKHSSAEREDRDPAGSRPFLGRREAIGNGFKGRRGKSRRLGERTRRRG